VTPDHDRDIVIHRFSALDALTGAAIGDRWSVWLGRESRGTFADEGQALAEARALTEETGRPVWLQDHGRTIHLPNP
jgi:hypothetical protein